MNHLRDERGVAPILELVLVALVLALAGVAVYSATHHKTTATVATTASASPTKTASSSPSPSPTASPSNELDVPQLHFKMSLPAGLSGITYSIDPNTTGTANNTTYTVYTARFTTQYLQANQCYANASPTGQIGIGAISMYLVDPETLGIGEIVGGRKVGNVYLSYQTPQSECGSNPVVNDNQIEMIKLMGQAFDTATPL